MTRNLAKAEALQGAVIRGFAKKGVQARILPEGILNELANASADVLEEEAAADPDFARVLESQRAFSADYAIWQRLAYPSRP